MTALVQLSKNDWGDYPTGGYLRIYVAACGLGRTAILRAAYRKALDVSKRPWAALNIFCGLLVLRFCKMHVNVKNNKFLHL